MTDTREWGVVANVTNEAPLREGARVVLQGIAFPRARVLGLSLGGRRIRKWVAVKNLNNLRPQWVTPGSRGWLLFDSKEAAAEFCAK